MSFRKTSSRIARASAILAGATFVFAAPFPARLRAIDPPALSPTNVPPPPATRADNVTDDYFGTKVADPYRWLEDQNSPETRAWIEKENDYTNSILSKLPGRDTLRAQLGSLLKVDSMGTPTERGGRYFFTRRAAADDQGKLYVRQGRDGADQVLIDPLPMSPDHSITVGLDAVSSDGALIAYSLRQGGADETTPHLYDVNARHDLSDQLPHARYSGLDFTKDNKSVFYTYQTPKGPRVFRHDIGASADQDKIVWGDGVGPEKIIGSGVTDDGAYLMITLYYGASADRTDIYVAPLAEKEFAVRPIINDVDARFLGDEGGGKLYFQTNWKAPNSKVIAVDLAKPQRDNWKTVIPEAEVHIENMALVGGKICVVYSKNASSLLRLFDADGKLVREVALPTLGSASALLGRWSSAESFYLFNSFFVPPTIFRYDVNSGAQSTWWRSTAPVDSDKFTMQQVWYASKDGTRIPMFVAHKKGLKLDGSNPAYMTAYGGFNVNIEPGFDSAAVTWMEHGGVYAVPNLRGGGEFGENWHKAGMLEKKQNVFDDFFAAAEWLISNHYTSSSKLAAEGRSNGGLLMGAAMTQRPDLFGAIICGYPLLDMLRYQNFLVARYWVPEYGSSEDAAQFKYIYAYSPYQHVKKGAKYPGILFVSGDSDTRVAPLHARKMAALMQAGAAPGRPVLLKYDTKAGHSGGTPVTKRIEDTTDELNFLFWQLGITLN